MTKPIFKIKDDILSGYIKEKVLEIEPLTIITAETIGDISPMKIDEARLVLAELAKICILDFKIDGDIIIYYRSEVSMNKSSKVLLIAEAKKTQEETYVELIKTCRNCRHMDGKMPYCGIKGSYLETYDGVCEIHNKKVYIDFENQNYWENDDNVVEER